MENEFVSYTQALALKELGFDESTYNWRQHGNGISGNVEGKRDYYNRKGDVYVALPRYSQVFRWFREKHNIRVWTEWGSEYLCCAMIQYSSGIKECIDCCSNDEEAESACLDKLIEITKTDE
jgi:hypothetical protein